MSCYHHGNMSAGYFLRWSVQSEVGGIPGLTFMKINFHGRQVGQGRDAAPGALWERKMAVTCPAEMCV